MSAAEAIGPSPGRSAGAPGDVGRERRGASGGSAGEPPRASHEPGRASAGTTAGASGAGRDRGMTGVAPGAALSPARPDRLVLVVDDEPDLLQIVCDRLESAGYRVRTARDGLEALERIREDGPGCVILDLKMPRLGGFDALPEIRRAAPAARVIVLTGSPNRPLREACQARGADEFILKPFDPGELLRLTAQAFEPR